MGHALSNQPLEDWHMKTSDQPKSRMWFTHFERVFWIMLQLSANRYPNARIIAEHFEVTAKTAQRTLEFMRDRMRLPLAYSAEQRGWYYTEPIHGMNPIEMTEGELVAILLVERL